MVALCWKYDLMHVQRIKCVVLHTYAVGSTRTVKERRRKYVFKFYIGVVGVLIVSRGDLDYGRPGSSLAEIHQPWLFQPCRRQTRAPTTSLCNRAGKSCAVATQLFQSKSVARQSWHHQSPRSFAQASPPNSGYWWNRWRVPPSNGHTTATG